MSTIVGALLPVAGLILLGHLFRRTGFLDEGGWAALERLVYYVLFPCLLFLALSQTSLKEVQVGSVVLLFVLVTATMAVIATLMHRFWPVSGPAYTSLLQGVVRWNSYVALALGPLLFGTTGTAVIALAVAILTPAANVLSVAALARYGGRSGGGMVSFLRAIATNPLIVACVLGELWAWIGLDLPVVINDMLTILARATLGLGLLTVGAGLRPVPLRASSLTLGAAVGGKLVVSPLLGLTLGAWLALDPVTLGACVLTLGVPTSSSSYILARLAGGDAELMAAIITAQTITAMLTLPFFLFLAAG